MIYMTKSLLFNTSDLIYYLLMRKLNKIVCNGPDRRDRVKGVDSGTVTAGWRRYYIHDRS